MLLYNLQKACRNERVSLSFLQSIRQAVRLAFGLSPNSSSSSGGEGGKYPCTLTGDSLDSTWLAAAVITGGSSSRGTGSSCSSRGSSKGAGVDSTAARNTALDLDLPVMLSWLLSLCDYGSCYCYLSLCYVIMALVTRFAVCTCIHRPLKYDTQRTFRLMVLSCQMAVCLNLLDDTYRQQQKPFLYFCSCA